VRHIIIAAVLILASLHAGAQDTVRKPKIGLVLSGGGAKGFAHVGALKVIEEAGIPVSYITGTSIGSIVGGLYSVGYDATTLENIIGRQNWEDLLSNESKRKFMPAITRDEQARYLFSLPVKSKKISIPDGVLNGQKAMDLFSYLTYGYHDITDFSRLPIPFRCIATDIATGEEVVMDKGYLPKAMRASMSVPAVFSACIINDRMLVDGGVTNNFPVDRCREMGADVIIGVDIGDELMSKDKIQTLPDMILQLTTLMGFERSIKNSRDADILIRPDITGYSASSFNTGAARVLMRRGEDAARKIMPELIRLRDSLGLPMTKPLSHQPPDSLLPLNVKHIEVEGTEKSNIISILGRMGISKDKMTTLQGIHEGIERIYATGNYQNVDYKISGDDSKTVTIMVRESSTNRLSVGLNYNTDLNAAGLINMTFYSDRISGSNLSIDAKLSTSPMFSARYSLDRGFKPGFIVSTSYISDKLLGYSDNKKVSEINIRLTNLNIGTQAVVSDIFRIAFGGSVEYFHFGSAIGDIDTASINDKTFFNYFLTGSLDQIDDPFFPSTGWSLNGTVRLITDNGLQYEGKSPVPVAGLDIKTVKKVSERVVIIPAFRSRFAFASHVPVFYRSYLGGFQQTDYFGNYLPFTGLRRMEISADNVAFCSLDVRVRLWTKFYLTLLTDFGMLSDKTEPGTGDKLMLGGGISAAYSSVVGPVEIILSTSNLNKNLIPYFTLGYYF
jgi:NTE family protein